MDKRWYLGIDIGGSSAKYALISQTGEKKHRGQFPTGRGIKRQDLLHGLSQIVEAAICEKIDGVGISTLGVVHPKTGMILGGVENLPAIEGLALKDILHAHHPHLNVLVCNDAKAVALGEHWLGAARGCDNFFCITLGTGLGGSAFLNGQVVEGAHHRAGEIGYLDCDALGRCCEHRLSTGYVMKQAAQRLGKPAINGLEFFALVRQNETTCREILEDWTNEIARLVANIILLLDPEKILIGGGVSNEGLYLLTPICRQIWPLLPRAFCGQTEIVMAECGNDAGMLGAVSGFL